MFSSKYYDNPFADDDDDLCYGEIQSEHGDAPANASPEVREKRNSAHIIGSSVTGPRRNGAESSSAEIPLSTVHNTDEWNGSAAHRGQVDTHDYEEYIAELRSDLEKANAENSRLTAAQTKAETRARSLLFDKENAEWQLAQEKERTRTLMEKVQALEEELEQMAARQSEAGRSGGRTPAYATSEAPRATAPPPRSHVDPHAPAFHLPHETYKEEGAAAAPDVASAPMPDRQRSTAARAQFEQRQAAYVEARGGSFERNGSAVESVVAAPAAAERISEPPYATSANPSLTRSLRGQRRADAVQEQIQQQRKDAEEQAIAVKGLEDLLQTHCQKRDEFAQQLQRLESMRLRTVAEKRKKAAVEQSLEEEEKTIGHIRLELRSHSALLR